MGYVIITNDLRMAFVYFSQIPLVVWLVVFLLTCVAVSIGVVRTKLFLVNHSFMTLLRVRLISTAYSFILPGQMAAEGVRAYLLGKEDNNYGQSSAAVGLDKLIGVISLLVLGVVGLIVTRSLEWSIVITLTVFLVGLLSVILVLNITPVYTKIHGVLAFLSKKTGKIGKGFAFALRIAESWQGYVNNKRLLLKNFAYGLFFQFFVAIICMLLTYGVGAGFYFFDWLWIHAMLTFVLLLPVSLGGMGIREGSLVGLLGFIGVEAEQALAVSFGFLAVQLAQAAAGFGFEIWATLQKRKSHEE